MSCNPMTPLPIARRDCFVGKERLRAMTASTGSARERLLFGAKKNKLSWRGRPLFGPTKQSLLFSAAVVLALSWSGTAFAQSRPADPTGFRFLTIGGGARSVALAETMVAEGDDAFVTEYNPAGLVGTKRFVLAFSHNTFFQDTRGEYFAVAVPKGQWAFGARLAYLGTGDIPKRLGPSTDPIGYYDAASGVFQGAVARIVDDRLSIGISAAYVLEHIESETAQSPIFGLGARYRVHRNVNIGMSFTNVGPMAKFQEQEFRMPNHMRVGGIWSDDRLSLRAELLAAEEERLRWHFGSEFTPDPRLAVRAGVRIGYDTQTFSAGAGLRTSDQRIGIDYAFAPYSDDLGSTHRFGLTVHP